MEILEIKKKILQKKKLNGWTEKQNDDDRGKSQ